MNRQMWCMVWLVVLAFGAGGCGGRTQAYNVVVWADESLGATSVAVDLVGADRRLVNTLSTIPVSEYFTPGNEVRAAVDRKTLRFVDGEDERQILHRSDPIWNRWMYRDATHLLVIANLLGAFEDQPGAADDRRLILPLRSDRQGRRTIHITVKETAVELRGN